MAKLRDGKLFCFHVDLFTMLYCKVFLSVVVVVALDNSLNEDVDVGGIGRDMVLTVVIKEAINNTNIIFAKGRDRLFLDLENII